MKQHHGENNNPKDEKQQAIQDTWRKFIADCETNQPEDQCLSILFRTGCKGFGDFQQWSSDCPGLHGPEATIYAQDGPREIIEIFELIIFSRNKLCAWSLQLI